MNWVTELARPDIVALAPYEHAAWRPELERLHANEAPWRQPGDTSIAGLNRYPEPQPVELIARLAALYDVAPECLLVTRGSDEAIDLLVRAFCRAGEDAVLVCPPTFGMYVVTAEIQGAAIANVPLRPESGFDLDEAVLLARCTKAVKLVFLCSPNSPTGNLLSEESVLRIARQLEGRCDSGWWTRRISSSRRFPSLARRVRQMAHLAVAAHTLQGSRSGGRSAVAWSLRQRR